MKKSWKFEERCTAILFRTTMVMAECVPDSSKILEMHETCISNVVKVLREGRREGAEDFTLQVISTWNWDDVYRRKRHRGPDGNIRYLVRVWKRKRRRLYAQALEPREERGDFAAGFHHQTGEKRWWNIHPQRREVMGSMGPLLCEMQRDGHSNS